MCSKALGAAQSLHCAGLPTASLLTEAHQLARDTAELASRATKAAGVATKCAFELMMPKK